jgi:hypothetical protein
MRTTTVVYKFDPAPSAEHLAATAAAYQEYVSPVLSHFAFLHNLVSIADPDNLHKADPDNLVSLTVDHETCLRTVVRSWPDSDIANAWITTSLETKLWLNNDFPGMIISAQVDPE